MMYKPQMAKISLCLSVFPFSIDFNRTFRQTTFFCMKWNSKILKLGQWSLFWSAYASSLQLLLRCIKLFTKVLSITFSSLDSSIIQVYACLKTLYELVKNAFSFPFTKHLLCNCELSEKMPQCSEFYANIIRLDILVNFVFYLLATAILLQYCVCEIFLRVLTWAGPEMNFQLKYSEPKYLSNQPIFSTLVKNLKKALDSFR